MGQVGGRVSGVINYSLYEFRNLQRWRIFKQNWIISISSRVIEFWCFWLPVALGGSGVGGWGWGWLEDAPTHVHMHTHACTHMHAHACMVNMVISCKWPPPLGKSLGIPYDVIRTCVCVHMCACACMCMWVGCTPSAPPPPSTHCPTPRGDPRNHSKFNSTWTNQDISILFEDLKSVKTPPPMGGCIIWWVGGWLGGLMGGARSNH